MKVSTIILVSFASWVAAHPGLPHSEKVENNSEDVRAERQEKPNVLIENLISLKDKFTPLQLIENEKLGDLGTFNIAQQSIEKYGIPTSPIAFFFGKDNFIISTILNVIGTAKEVIGTAKEVLETIKSNVKKVIKLPFLARGEKTSGASLGFEKTDSAQLKGHESSDKDDSRLSTEIEGIDMNEVKEGYSNGYRKSTEGDAKEIANEKHVIQSADSPVSWKENAKTDTSERKHSEGSQISTKLEEKSASAKKQSHSAEKAEKTSLTNAKEETFQGPMNVTEKVAADEKKDNSKKSRRSVVAY
ncbi:uncharacterized protein LOC122568221 [Bombus pyrosoma]|uniref:uncharacterized protein LOC122568221 n=1 Tax=Bombus pyrosoma TaxID=396416 RepID=UPI001CB911A8|nr:uncharacterized protein LOC122568221 [Bombus pyrosoma]